MQDGFDPKNTDLFAVFSENDEYTEHDESCVWDAREDIASELDEIWTDEDFEEEGTSDNTLASETDAEVLIAEEDDEWFDFNDASDSDQGDDGDCNHEFDEGDLDDDLSSEDEQLSDEALSLELSDEEITESIDRLHDDYTQKLEMRSMGTKGDVDTEETEFASHVLGKSVEEQRAELLKDLKDAQSDLRYYQGKLSDLMRDKQNGWIGVDPAIRWKRNAIESCTKEIREIERKLSRL